MCELASTRSAARALGNLHGSAVPSVDWKGTQGMTETERIVKLAADLAMASRALDMAVVAMNVMHDTMKRADAEIQCLKIEVADLKAELGRE